MLLNSCLQLSVFHIGKTWALYGTSIILKIFVNKRRDVAHVGQ